MEVNTLEKKIKNLEKILAANKMYIKEQFYDKVYKDEILGVTLNLSLKYEFNYGDGRNEIGYFDLIRPAEEDPNEEKSKEEEDNNNTHGNNNNNNNNKKHTIDEKSKEKHTIDGFEEESECSTDAEEGESSTDAEDYPTIANSILIV